MWNIKVEEARLVREKVGEKEWEWRKERKNDTEWQRMTKNDIDDMRKDEKG